MYPRYSTANVLAKAKAPCTFRPSFGLQCRPLLVARRRGDTEPGQRRRTRDSVRLPAAWATTVALASGRRTGRRPPMTRPGAVEAPFGFVEIVIDTTWQPDRERRFERRIWGLEEH